MRSILFIHQNFPAQFGGIATYLARSGWRVVFATAADHVSADNKVHKLLPGVRVVGFRRAREASENIHSYLPGTEHAVLNAQAFFRVGAALKRSGFNPDVIVAHSGWGSGSLAKVVWPEARFIQYLEWWYNYPAIDAAPGEIPRNPADFAAQTLCRNLPFLLDVQSADAILVPTHFQAARLPALLTPRVHVIHDGIDDSFFRPARTGDTAFTADGLPDDAPIVTYATRGMEPMRGFPQFMAAWAQLQVRYPDLHCVIAGTDRVCYGPKLPPGDSYRKRALAAHDFDRRRLHFVGRLPKPTYRALLQRSAAHVYLTRPFVPSWSLTEAMLTATPLVAANTEPVQEIAPAALCRHVDMDAPDRIATAVSDLLENPGAARDLARKARRFAQGRYAARLTYPRLADLFANISASQSGQQDMAEPRQTGSPT